MTSYISLIKHYENNPPLFFQSLDKKSNPEFTALFWKTLSERREDATSILSAYTAHLINASYPPKKLNRFIETALKQFTEIERAKIATEFYNLLDPVYYLYLYDELSHHCEPAKLWFHMTGHLFMLTENKEFPFIFKELLRLIGSIPQNNSACILEETFNRVPEPRIYFMLNALWSSLSTSAQCRLIPHLSLEFTLSKVPGGTVNELSAWLHTLIYELKHIRSRTTYFIEFLEALPKDVSLVDLVSSTVSLNGSPALLHFLTDLTSRQFCSLFVLGAEPFTDFLYSVEIKTPEEAQHIYTSFKSDLGKWNYFLDETSFLTYENDQIAGVESPRSFINLVDSAFRNQSVNGLLLDAYIERIQNIPPVLWIIYAAHENHLGWLTQCSPYLSETQLRNLAFCLDVEPGYLVFNYLWRQNKIQEMALYFEAAPEPVKKRLLEKLLLWFRKKANEAKRAESAFKDLTYNRINYPLLYARMQQTLSVRREIDGLLGRYFITLSRQEDPYSPFKNQLQEIETIVLRTRKKVEKWSGPAGPIRLVYQLQPDVEEDTGSLVNFPRYIEEALNTRLLNHSDLSSAEALYDRGLANERDMKALGLSKEPQLLLDKLQMGLNGLYPDASPLDIALAWEKIREVNDIPLPDLITDLKEVLKFKDFQDLVPGEEAELRFEINKLLLEALDIPFIDESLKEKGREFSRLGAPISSSFDWLVEVICRYSFENRLTEYLDQLSLRHLWQTWHLHQISGLHELQQRHNLKTQDLFSLSKIFNPEQKAS